MFDFDVIRPSGEEARQDYLALMDRRMLERECLAHGLEGHDIGLRVLTFCDLKEWQTKIGAVGKPTVVLYNAGNRQKSELREEIAELVAAVTPAAVVVLSDDQEISMVLDIIALGVRGYIPSSVNIDVCIRAIGLAQAGGQFIPSSSIMEMRELLKLQTSGPLPPRKFTSRQHAIAEALRCGKANKDIAQEMNLCESTIKVHIRNIMRKLGATNRTEVASKIGAMVH